MAQSCCPARTIGHGAVCIARQHHRHKRRVEPYAIVGGNPARLLKRRFMSDIAARLEALAWWDWDHERLRAALPDFRTLAIEAFLEKYERVIAQTRAQALTNLGIELRLWVENRRSHTPRE